VSEMLCAFLVVVVVVEVQGRGKHVLESGG
jgi:hypothetical protein